MLDHGQPGCRAIRRPEIRQTEPSPRRDADGTTRSLNVLQLESLGSTPPDWARVQVGRIAGVRQEIAGVPKLKRGASNGDGAC
jgi:hypothetical protein